MRYISKTFLLLADTLFSNHQRTKFSINIIISVLNLFAILWLWPGLQCMNLHYKSWSKLTLVKYECIIQYITGVFIIMKNEEKVWTGGNWYYKPHPWSWQHQPIIWTKVELRLLAFIPVQFHRNCAINADKMHLLGVSEFIHLCREIILYLKCILLVKALNNSLLSVWLVFQHKIYCKCHSTKLCLIKRNIWMYKALQVTPYESLSLFLVSSCITDNSECLKCARGLWSLC